MVVQRKAFKALKEQYNSEISIEDWLQVEIAEDINKAKDANPLLVRGSGVVRKQGHFKEKNGRLYFVGGEL